MAAFRQVSWGLILIALVTFAGCSGSDTGESDPVMVTVSGRVVDSRGNLVSGATIIIDGQPVDVQTNVDGAFSIEIEAGDHELTITMGTDVIAVIPVSVSEGGPNDLGEITPTAPYYPWYEDSDEDGYGNSDIITNDENQPLGYVINGDDCDDSAPSINPGATEICNSIDDNCNSEIDEGVLLSFYQDSDVDGFGNLQATQQSCSVPDGYVVNDTDCDDSDAAVNPNAAEICNSIDDNCNSEVDEGVLLSFYQDSDVDGFGNWLAPQQSCSVPEGYVSDDTDCDDSASSIYPGAPEVCNDIDDNCNMQIDEGVSIMFYRDADEDEYGSMTDSIEACSNPEGYLTDNTDCDDTEPGLNPETIWYPDGDQDNYPINSSALMQCLAPAGSNVPDYLTAIFDCDDSDPLINPGNLEILGNSIDDDCNSGTPDNAAVYNMSDLQGDWKLYGINAGDYTNNEWNGWMQGSVSFDDKGQLTDYFLEYDDGFVETSPDLLFVRIDSEGIVTLVGDPMFHGAISQDKDMIVATNTDLEGGYTMLILQKAAAAVTLADFKGLWNTNAIVAGDEPSWSGWYRGTIDVRDSGTVNFDLDRSDNDQDAGFVQYDVNPDGDLESHWNVRSISADRQLAVGRADYEDGFGLEVLTKSGGAFGPGNLEGDWSFHVLSAGDAPEINDWTHGMIHFDNAGTGAVNYQASSDPTSALSLGALSVDSAGKIVSSTIQTFAGALSNDKDTIVATFTNESGGASMMIALRRDPPPLEIITEESISASAIFSPAVGGSLQVTASDGTQFELTIPPDAIDSDQDVLIKMTPVAGLGGLPISGNFLGAVQLAPEGLQLSNPATLTVNLPSAVPVTDLLAYAYQGSGSRFHFSLVLPDAEITSTAIFDIPILHFSGGGGGTGNSGDPAGVPLDPAAQGGFYESLIVSAYMEEGNGDRVDLILRDWFDKWVWGLVSQANTVDEVNRAAQEFWRWDRWRQLLGLQDTVYAGDDPNVGDPTAFERVNDKITSTIMNTVRDLGLACGSNISPPGTSPEWEYTDPCGFGRQLLHEAKQWYRLSEELNQQMGFSPHFQMSEIVDFCGGIGTRLASGAQISPMGRILVPNETGEFLAVLIDSTGQELPQHDPVLQPRWHSSVPDVASVAGSPPVGQAYFATVTGHSRGGVIISANDELDCPAAQAFVTVDASGPYTIKVDGRSDDNCHYMEPPDMRPIPDILVPRSAGLTFTPVIGDPEGKFRLDWAKGDGGMYMTGNSSNSTEVTISGVAEDSFRADHLLRFSQSCELIVGAAELVGKCEFAKLEAWDVTTPADICNGKYWITGWRLTPP